MRRIAALAAMCLLAGCDQKPSQGQSQTTQDASHFSLGVDQGGNPAGLQPMLISLPDGFYHRVRRDHAEPPDVVCSGCGAVVLD